MPPKGGSSNRANPSRRRGSTPRGGGGARGHVRGGGNVADPGRVLAFDTPESGDLADEEQSDSDLDPTVKRVPKPVEHRVESPPAEERPPSSQDSSYEREGQPARSTGEPIYGLNSAGEFVATPGIDLGRPVRVVRSGLSSVANQTWQERLDAFRPRESSQLQYELKQDTESSNTRFTRQLGEISGHSRVPSTDRSLPDIVQTSALDKGGKPKLPQPTDSDESRGHTRTPRLDPRNIFQGTSSEPTESARSEAQTSSSGHQGDVDSRASTPNKGRRARPLKQRSVGQTQRERPLSSEASVEPRRKKDPAAYRKVRGLHMAGDPVRDEGIATSDRSEPMLTPYTGGAIWDPENDADFRRGPASQEPMQVVAEGLSAVAIGLGPVRPPSPTQYSTSTDTSLTAKGPRKRLSTGDVTPSPAPTDTQAYGDQGRRQAPMPGTDSADSGKGSSAKPKKKGGPKAKSDKDADKRSKKPDDGTAGGRSGKKYASAW